MGVVADQSTAEIGRLVRELSLDVIQLHADPDVARVRDVRAAAGVEVWAVLRIAGAELPTSFAEIRGGSHAIVLDARVPGGLGGTGVTLPWVELEKAVRPWREDVHIVLAGGLRPENVSEAIAAMEPDVVDVSSGVESAPGIKDHALMRAFVGAVQRAGVTNGP